MTEYNFDELEQELDLAGDSISEARARWELQDAMNIMHDSILEQEARERLAEQAREEMVCAWADYRKEYGIGSSDLRTAHKAFIAGWKAAKGHLATDGVLL